MKSLGPLMLALALGLCAAPALAGDREEGSAAMGIEGYRGAEVLRRPDGEEVAFMTVLRFDERLPHFETRIETD